MNGVTTAAIAETVIVSYRSIRAGKAATGAKGVQVAGTATQSPYKMPLPSEYTSVVIVFGALHLLEPAQPQIAGLMAWALVAATFLKLWQPGSGSMSGLSKSTTASTSTTAKGS